MLECRMCISRCLGAIIGEASNVNRTRGHGFRRGGMIAARSYSSRSRTYLEPVWDAGIDEVPEARHGRLGWEGRHARQDARQDGEDRQATEDGEFAPRRPYDDSRSVRPYDDSRSVRPYDDSRSVNQYDGYGERPEKEWDVVQRDEFNPPKARYSKENGVPKKEWTKENSVIRTNLRRTGTDAQESQEVRLTNEMERKIKKELVWLRDPMKLADHVRQTLRSNDPTKALGLCRVASRDMQCVVSWNHCIGWLLSHKKANEALKVYNEMKKRAQFPDSHTYAIILRGLSEPPIHPDTVGKALSVYHSLAAPNSRVKQTTIHTNAALRVCARAYDLDSLWGIASKLPPKGPGAANAYTYTTILNALRENVLYNGGESKTLVDDELLATMRAQAVQEGRRVWAEVIAKWRTGDVIVDEEVTCAMGRLLLIEKRPRDWDDVLSLVEQAMDIPRLTPKLGTAMRKTEHLPFPPRVLAEDFNSPHAAGEPPASEFDKALVLDKRGKQSVSFVNPGNNTLSLVLEACLKMCSFKPANEYFKLLTDDNTYGIQPDMDNMHMYMRLLRQSRASARTVELLEKDFERAGLVPMRKTWRIGMSAVVRDKMNVNAIDHANKLLHLMERYNAEADAKTLVMYLNVAISTGKGLVITDAITRLTPSVTVLKSNISFGGVETGKSSKTDKEDVTFLFRTIVGAIDQVIYKRMVDQAEITVWSKRRAKIAAWISRLDDKMAGKFEIPRERVTSMRKATRQLRHFKRNELKREKKATGQTWEKKKKVKAGGDELLDFPGET